jgi:hypothetical protein
VAPRTPEPRWEPQPRRNPRGVPRDGEEDPSSKIRRMLEMKKSEDRWGRH